jgi:hypothetical protein
VSKGLTNDVLCADKKARETQVWRAKLKSSDLGLGHWLVRGIEETPHKHKRVWTDAMPSSRVRLAVNDPLGGVGQPGGLCMGTQEVAT